MNIRGIELLRRIGLPGPKKELVFSNEKEVDLDYLYTDCLRGTTIIVFDSAEPINQNPLYEKDVRKYKIERKDYFTVFKELVAKMQEKGVRRENMLFLTHQTYTSDDIIYSGRITVHIDNNGFGLIKIDAFQGLRKGQSTIDPDYIYSCKVVGTRIIKSSEKVYKSDFNFPGELLSRIIRDVRKISGNPNIDFEVYKENGALFYHDMFLDI
ncbi:MAG: hypothetical protein ACP5N3_05050 [Candidatus Nanoarchaeia archaeon]